MNYFCISDSVEKYLKCIINIKREREQQRDTTGLGKEKLRMGETAFLSPEETCLCVFTCNVQHMSECLVHAVTYRNTDRVPIETPAFFSFFLPINTQTCRTTHISLRPPFPHHPACLLFDPQGNQKSTPTHLYYNIPRSLFNFFLPITPSPCLHHLYTLCLVVMDVCCVQRTAARRKYSVTHHHYAPKDACV